MGLLAATTHNCHGVLDASVALGDYSLLVGPHNAGVSTVIAATDRSPAWHCGSSDEEAGVLVSFSSKCRMGVSNDDDDDT